MNLRRVCGCNKLGGDSSRDLVDAGGERFCDTAESVGEIG
jgi:hypothetical protein